MKLKKISDIAHEIHWSLKHLQGGTNVLRKGLMLFWVVEKEGWFSLRYFVLSDFPKGFVRIRSDARLPEIKKFWPHKIVKLPQFEMTVHQSEINAAFVKDLRDFVGFLVEERDEIYTWDIFEDADQYPDYGWSKVAKNIRSASRK